MKILDGGATILIGIAIYWVVAGWLEHDKCYLEKQVQTETELVTVGSWSAENCEGMK